MNKTTGSIIEKMIRYFGKDARRINHALKVHGFAACIASKESLSENEAFIVEAAAILHDIGIHEAERKYNSSGGKYQEIEGPAIAQSLLTDEDIDTKTLERICFIIGNHHSYQKIDGLDFQILVEADFLVNIFEDEMPQHSVENVKNKYFKTETGKAMVEGVYL